MVSLANQKIHILVDPEIYHWFKEFVFLRLEPILLFDLGRSSSFLPTMYRGAQHLLIPFRKDMLMRVSLHSDLRSTENYRDWWCKQLDRHEITPKYLGRNSCEIKDASKLSKILIKASETRFNSVAGLLRTWEKRVQQHGAKFGFLYEYVEYTPCGNLSFFLRSNHLSDPAIIIQSLQKTYRLIYRYLTLVKNKKGILNLDWKLKNFLVGKQKRVFLADVYPSPQSISWHELHTDGQKALLEEPHLVCAGLLLVSVLSTIPSLLCGKQPVPHTARHCLVNKIVRETIQVICEEEQSKKRSAYIARALESVTKLRSSFVLTKPEHNVVTHVCHYAVGQPITNHYSHKDVSILHLIFFKSFWCPLCPEIPEWIKFLPQLGNL